MHRTRNGSLARLATRAAPALAMLAVAGPALAGKVDLVTAGCPPFPEAAKRVGIWIVLHEDGTAEACEIETGGGRNCADAYDEREGFLCISFNGDKHPRSVNTTAEGPRSSRIDALVVDGTVAEPVYGYANSRYVAEFGSGPSGDTYAVEAHTKVGAKAFTTRVDVTNVGDNTVRIDALSVTYAD